MNDEPVFVELWLGLELPKKTLFGVEQKPPCITLRKIIPLNDSNKKIWEKIILHSLKNPDSSFRATVTIAFKDPYKAIFNLKEAGFLSELSGLKDLEGKKEKEQEKN